MKRTLAILMAVLMLATCSLACAAPVQRQEPEIELAYAHTDRIFVLLNIDSSGKASCSG